VGYSLFTVLLLTILVSLNTPITHNNNEEEDEDIDTPHSPMPTIGVFFEEDIQKSVSIASQSLSNRGIADSPSLKKVLRSQERVTTGVHDNKEDLKASDQACSASVTPLSSSSRSLIPIHIPMSHLNDTASAVDTKNKDDKSNSTNLSLPSAGNKHETNIGVIREKHLLRSRGRAIEL